MGYSKIICSFALCVSFFFSCKTVPNFEEYVPKTTTSLPALHLEKKEEGKEEQKRDDLLPAIEIASYNSLKKVLDIVLENPVNTTSRDKLYLYLSLNLLEKLYPYAKIEQKPPQYSKKNKYVEGFESIKRLEYPYEMEREDFLSTIIPALLLLNEKFPAMFVDDAKDRINLAKRFNPASPLPYYLEGLLLELKSESQKAMNTFKKAIEKDASFYPAILKYAKLCNDAGNYEDAIKVLSMLPDEYNTASEVKFLNAFSYIGKKDMQKANQYISALAEENATEGEALFERVRLLIEKGEYMKANSLLNIYTVKNKTEKNYLLLKMRIAREWNKNEKTALQYLAKAYEYYPTSYDVLVECANATLDAETTINGRDAAFFIEQISNIELENVHTIKVLLKKEIKDENWAEAVKMANSLVAKNPSAKNRELLVKAYLGNGKASEALREASLLYREHPSSSNEVFFDYMEALYQTGNISTLNALIRQHLQESRGEQKSMLYYYSALSAGKGSSNYISLLRTALLTNPRNKTALFSMYEWYFANKDYRNAQFYLKQAIGVEGGENKKHLALYENLNQLLGI